MTNNANWVGGVAPVDGSAWVFTNSSILTLTNGFVGYSVGGLSFSAAGNNFSLRGNAFTLTGDITNASTSQITISNSLTVDTSILITNTTSGYVTLGGVLTGSGTITYGAASGSGRLVLQGGGHSGFTGALIANSGRVNLGNNQSSASADYTFSNGGGTFLTTSNSTFNFGSLSGSAIIQNNTASRTNTVSIGAKGTSTTFSGDISLSNSSTINVVKVGTGTLTLSGANTYNGTTTVSNGVLQLGAGGAAGSIANSASITLAGGSLGINRSDAVTQGVEFTGSALTGAGGFIQLGSGTTTLTAANTYTGDTVVSGGALLLSNAAAIQSSALNMAGGSLLFDGALTAVTAGGLNGTGGLVLTNNNGDAVTLTLSNAASTALSDTTTISGAGGLVLSGSGTQTLSGASTFSGGFVLNAGSQVQVGASAATTAGGLVTASSLGAGAITINGGTIFGNSGTIGSVTTTITDDFAVNSGAAGGLNARLRLFGGIDMAGGERTGSLGRYFNSAETVLASGNESLKFELASGGPATAFTNGTLRFIRDATGGAGDYVAVRFEANTGVFDGNAGFTVGSNVITTMASSFVFNAFGSRPQVGVEAGGYFNLSDNANARNASIQTLSGSGTVTSLASNASTSTLTILPDAGDNEIFSGQIVDGSSLTGLVGGAATTMALTLNGAGTQTLSGANTYTGATTISAGTLQIGNGGTSGSLNASSAIANNGTLIFNRSDDVAQGTDFSTAAITGTGGLVKHGAGTLTLNAANAFSGPTSLEQGTIIYTINNAIGSGTVTMADGTALSGSGGTRTIGNNIVVNGDVALNDQGSGGSFNGNIDLTGATRQINVASSSTFNGVISNGSLVMDSTASFRSMTLTASNTFDDVTVLRGILRLSGSGALSSGSAVDLAPTAGTSTFEISLVSASSVTIGSLAGNGGGALVDLGAKELITGGNNASTVFAGVLSNTGSLTKTGTGTMTLSGANVHEGGTTVEAGTLDVANTSALGTGTLVQSDGTSTVQFSTSGTVANDMSVYNVAFTANGTTLSGTITNNNTAYDVGSGLTNTISGFLTGSGGVTKAGAGDLVLTASNNFTGAVDVQGGLLDLASATGSAAGSTANVLVATNAVLLLSQSDQLNNTATVSLSGGMIQRGSGVSEVFGDLSLSTGSFLDFGTGTAGTLSFGAYTPSSLLTVQNFGVGNTLTFGSDLTTTINNGSLFSFDNGFNSSWDGGTSTFTITAIPEPSTVLAVAGLLAMMLWPTRRRLLKDAKSILGLRAPARDRLRRSTV